LALPLGDLPGATSLVPGTICYWRIRAQDRRGLDSFWSAGEHTFQFGIAAPQGGSITGIGHTTNGMMRLQWTGAAGQVYVEFTHSLSPTNWYTVAGPLSGTTNWTFTPLPGMPSGFYRLRCE
jgi:hypothetical protein